MVESGFGKRLWRSLRPGHSELSAFLIALASLGIVLLDGGLRITLLAGARASLHIHDDSGSTGLGPVFALVFLAGMALSFVHVFTSRRKSDVEKTLMLVFVILANGLAAICSTCAIVAGDGRLALLLPGINVINVVTLVHQLGLADAEMMIDADATSAGVVIGSLLVGGLLLALYCMGGVDWATTLSACVVVSTAMNSEVLDSLCLARPRT